MTGRVRVDLDEKTEEVEEGRDCSGNDNGDVGNLENLGHDEGNGAHDRGHDDAAGGGTGFHCAGKLGGVARLFHGRYGE